MMSPPCAFRSTKTKNADLSARELGEVLHRLMSHCPEDAGNEKAVIKWVAKQLNWMIENAKGQQYPDMNRVRKTLEDAEFQRTVPNITIKVRNRGDYKRPTAPLSVARQV